MGRSRHATELCGTSCRRRESAMSVTSTTATANGRNTSGVYGLLDAESANLLGTYVSEPDALRVVAQLAQRYGPTSPAVASLVLYRDDVPDDESVVAEGEELLGRALKL